MFVRNPRPIDAWTLGMLAGNEVESQLRDGGSTAPIGRGPGGDRGGWPFSCLSLSP
jgi:hypothetical protein